MAENKQSSSIPQEVESKTEATPTKTVSNAFQKPQKKITSKIPSSVSLPDLPAGVEVDDVVFDKSGLKYKKPDGGGGGGASIILTGDITGSGVTDSPVVTSINRPIDGGNQKIQNVAEPVLNSDAATKSYVDSHNPASQIDLVGAVTGSGSTGSPLTTAFSYPLDGGNQKIENVADPALGTDAANKSYVDYSLPSDSVELTGAVTGTGVTGTAISTSFSYPLDGGSSKIINVLNPTNPQDAATKDYVDNSSSSSQIELTGAVTGTGSTGNPLATTFTFPINSDNQRIINVATPTSDSDACTKAYTDSHVFFDFSLAGRDSDWSTDFPVGEKMQWDVFEQGAGTITKVGTGSNFTTFELQPGYMYKLNAQIGVGETEAAQFKRSFSWYDTATGSAIGLKGMTWGASDEAMGRLVFTPAIAFIEVQSASKQVHVECVLKYADITWVRTGCTCCIEVVKKL